MRALPFLALLLPGSALAQQQAQLVPTRDVTLIETPNGNANGAGRSVYVGVTSNSGIRRAILHFDVDSAIPAGSTITAVQLDLEVTSQGPTGGTQDWTLHQVLGDWGEGASAYAGGVGTAASPDDATWDCSFADGAGGCNAAWYTAGGDFNGLPDGTTNVGGPGLYAFATDPGTVARVQAWLDTPATNHGWLLKSTDEVTTGTSRAVASREAVAYSLPLLTVTYTAPGTGTGTAVGTGTGTGTGGCGVDTDYDTIGDLCDNCPGVANPAQDDTDNDTVGDACDLCPGDDLADANGDGRPDNNDTDLDGVADCVDQCVGGDDTVDTDGDAIADDCDNCPNDSNPLQEDTDNNGIGDVCEPTTTPTETGTGTGSGTATGSGTGTGTGATGSGTGTGTGMGTTGSGTGTGTGMGTTGTGTGTGTGTATGTGTGGDTGSGTGDDKGCGCATGSAPTGWLTLLPLLALVRRRR